MVKTGVTLGKFTERIGIKQRDGHSNEAEKFEKERDYQIAV